MVMCVGQSEYCVNLVKRHVVCMRNCFTKSFFGEVGVCVAKTKRVCVDDSAILGLLLI